LVIYLLSPLKLGDVYDNDGKKTLAMNTVKTPLVITLGISFVLLLFSPKEMFWVLLFVLLACSFGSYFSYWLAGYVFDKDDGTPEMRAVSDPIREGAEGFLKVQYGAIFKSSTIICVVIMGSYCVRPNSIGHDSGIETLGNAMLGAACLI